MKYFLITFLISSLNFNLHATEKISIKNKEVIYANLLSRFECVRGPNINNPQWICNEEAPKGWGKFYSDKLKRQKTLRKHYVEN